MKIKGCLIAALGVACAILLAGGRAQAAPVWLEIGDAGTLANPQFLTGGAFDAIVGALDPLDREDVYAFHWTETGDFFAINVEPVVPDWILLSLYDFAGQVAGTQIGQFAFSEAGLSLPGLAAGDYLLRLNFVPDPGDDPPYRIAITGPSPDPVSATVPEPSTLMLLSGGLAACALRGVRRTRQG